MRLASTVPSTFLRTRVTINCFSVFLPPVKGESFSYVCPFESSPVRPLAICGLTSTVKFIVSVGEEQEDSIVRVLFFERNQIRAISWRKVSFSFNKDSWSNSPIRHVMGKSGITDSFRL